MMVLVVKTNYIHKQLKKSEKTSCSEQIQYTEEDR